MKKFTFIFATAVTLLFFTTSSFAQEEGHYYTSTTWKISIPEDGSNAEFMELMQEWYDKVVLKNEKILSERVFRHQSGGDMRDWVFISEYASWNDIDAANNRQNELVNEGWSNADERSTFFKKFWKYVDTHSDEIYQELPTLRK